MVSGKRKIKQSHLTEIIFLILLITISSLLILDGSIPLAITVVSVSFILIFLSAAWSTQTLFPEVPAYKAMRILGLSLSTRILRVSRVVRIIDGMLENGQVKTHRLKGRTILAINEGSCAVISKSTGDYQLLMKGIHVLPPKAVLCAGFSTAPQHKHFGPESRSSLSPKQSGEGLADYHVRINTAKKTGTLTSNRSMVYPRFDVFYSIDIDHQINEILTLVKGNFAKDRSLSLLNLNQYFEDRFFQLAMKEWEQLSAGKSLVQLKKVIPFRFSQNNHAKNGATSIIYLGDVYSDESGKGE